MYRPRVIARVGVIAWRPAFDRPRATLGLQPDRIAEATVWVLPNTSGLNAHHQLPQLIDRFAALHEDVRPRLSA